MYTRRRIVLVSLLLVALAGLAGPAWGQNYLLPGTIYDQDKHFDDGNGWCNWYYDPLLDGYQYGDSIANSQAGKPDWSREADGSCWLASAANMLHYVGGPDMYETWAYGPQGVCYEGAWRHWNQGGLPSAALSQAGFDTAEPLSVGIGGQIGVWTNPGNIVEAIRANLAGAMPVGLGIYSTDMFHAITVVGIDTTLATMTVTDSDDGQHNVTHTYSYTINGDNRIQLVGYPGGPFGTFLDRCTTFITLKWWGSGTLGNTKTATSEPTTLWSNGENWGYLDHFNFTQICFANPGVVNVDTSATGLKLLLQNDLTTLNVIPGGSLTWEMLQNSGSHINLTGGTLVVHQDFIHSGTLAIGPGSIFGAGNVYMGTTFSGAGQITQTGGTASISTIVVGQDTLLSVTSNLTIQGGQFSAGDVTIGQKGIGALSIQGGQFSAANLTVGQKGVWGNYVQQSGTANVTDVITLASDAGSMGTGTLSGGNLTGAAMVLGNLGDGYLTHNGGKLKLHGMLVLGLQDGSSGRYLLGGSGQLEADLLIVGNGGAGTFEQDATSSVSANLLEVASGHPATYTIKNGTLMAASMSIGLGDNVSATFTQNSGLATVNGDLRLATSSNTSSGTYTMTGGTLSAQNIYVGDKGAGSVTQTGGAVNVVWTLNVGNGNTSTCTGHYMLNPAGIDGATLAAGRLVIRESSSFDHYNGSVNLGSDLTVAGNFSAIYRLYNGTLSAPFEFIGQAGKLGKFVQTGGTNNVSYNLTVLGIFHDETTYTISGNSNLNVGLDISNYGTFNLNGGTVTADRMLLNSLGVVNSSGSPTLNVNRLEGFPADFAFNGNLYFGHSGGGGSSATHAVAAGGSLAVSERLTVGFDAPATFTQTGGSVTSGWLNIGQYVGAIGAYNLSGAASWLTTDEEFVGIFGQGTFNQIDGSHTVNGPLHVAHMANGVGTFRLHGGSLMASELDLAEENNTVGTFIQYGGQATFPSGLKIARTRTSAHGIYQLFDGWLRTQGPEYIGETGAGEFYQWGGTHVWLMNPAEMYIGYNSSATGWYFINGGNLYADTGKIYVGHNGQGTLEISGTGLVVVDELVLGAGGTFTSAGGTLRVNKLTGLGPDPSFGGSLQIGHSAGLGQGSYSIAYRQSLTTRDLTVGYDAPCTFSQSGGVNTVSNYLVLGDQPGGQGSYTMDSIGFGFVSVSAAYQRIGSHGSGTFTQNNGNNTVSANIYLGEFAGSQGTYNLNGGNLAAHDLSVGYGGSGTMSQTAGTATISSYLVLGEQAGGQGTYTLGGTGSVSALYERIGFNGTGIFTQDAGGNTASSNMYIGEFAGSMGTYFLNGGNLTVGDLHIGYGDIGEFNWNGGSLSAGSVWIDSHGTMTCDHDWIYDKVLKVRGGTLSLPGGALTLQSFSPAPVANGEMTDGYILATDANIGSMGQAAFTQSGGHFNLSDSLYVAAAPAATGQFTLSGGILSANDEVIAYQGAGSMSQTGGTNRVFADLSLGRISGSSGAYEMNGTGARLTAGNVRVGNGGSGHFTHTLGNVSITGTLSLGYEATGSGVYDLGTGSLGANAEQIGAGGFGRFTQHNGTNTVGSGGLTLGNQPDSMGRYELSGGSLSVAGPTIIQGRGASGDHRIVQTGGQAHYEGGLVISDQTWGGSSRYELRGGGAWVTGDLVCNAQGRILLGGGMGVMAVSNRLLLNGGSLDVELGADSTVSWLAVNAAGPGAVNLASPALTLSLATGYTPGASAQAWTLIDPTDLSATIAGTFALKPEGTTFILGGRAFTLSYVGGPQHNDLVLTAPALPSANAVWMGPVSNFWAGASNWNPSSGVPDWTGTSVTFGEPSSNSIVDLQATGRTVGIVNFNSSVSTTIQGTGTLTLDNNTADVPITVHGSHTILAPLALKSDAAVTVSEAGSSLELGGAIADGGASHGLTKSGDGLLILGGNNTYTGGTTVDNGTLTFSNALALPAGGNVTTSSTGVVVFSSGYTGVITNGGPAAGSSSPVPEPGTTALLFAGVGGALVCLGKRRRAGQCPK